MFETIKNSQKLFKNNVNILFFFFFYFFYYSTKNNDLDPELKEATPSNTDSNHSHDSNNSNISNNTGDAIIGENRIGTTINNAITNLVISDDDANDIENDIELGYNIETRQSKCLTRIAAFIAGVFHGIAGPGGVLGVMVALKLNSWFYSSLYMLIFFISSIFTMGCYAIVYGYSTSRITLFSNNKQVCAYYLKIVSALFSIIVGVLWLSLTFTGTLDKIFD